MNAPVESVYIPLAVAPLPTAYTQTDRTKYDAEKAWWISQQVTILTRGYYSALHPEVAEAAHRAEKRSMALVSDAAGQSPEDFAETLRKNAERTLADWKSLYGNLLATNDGDHHIDYDKSHRPKADNVEKY